MTGDLRIIRLSPQSAVIAGPGTVPLKVMAERV